MSGLLLKQEQSREDMARSIASSRPGPPAQNLAEDNVRSVTGSRSCEPEQAGTAKDNDLVLQQRHSCSMESKLQPQMRQDSCGRERLKRHREEVAGRVMIPDSWGQESFLRDWIEYSAFDALLAQKGISSARVALVAEGQRAASRRLRIESRC